MRPSALPPIVMSKNTFGLAIAVLANRQNEKINLARVGCSKGRAEVEDLTRNARVYWRPGKCSGPPLVPNNSAFSLAKRTIPTKNVSEIVNPIKNGEMRQKWAWFS